MCFSSSLAFLIGSILFQNLKNGTFSLATFYARRIRRIFPALAVVLTTVLIISFIWLLPVDTRAVSLQALAGIGFVSNLLFWQQSGYFDVAAETKPLLHLWSLGIEEQFYLFWPLILWVAYRFRLPFLICALTLLASLTANLIFTHGQSVDSFYLPFTRVWELLAGTALAMVSLNNPRPRQPAWASNSLAVIGLALILYATIFFTKEQPFPGWRALFPVLGSVLIIAAQAPIGRQLLGNRVMRGLGIISYPLYLWHWPLLSFPKLLFTHPLSYFARVGVLAGSWHPSLAHYPLRRTAVSFRHITHPRRVDFTYCHARRYGPCQFWLSYSWAELSLPPRHRGMVGH